MNLKDRLKRLERKMCEEMEEFTLDDGTTARLPAGAGLEAFCACMDNVMASGTGAPLKPVPYRDVFLKVSTEKTLDLGTVIRGLLETEDAGD